MHIIKNLFFKPGTYFVGICIFVNIHAMEIATDYVTQQELQAKTLRNLIYQVSFLFSDRFLHNENKENKDTTILTRNYFCDLFCKEMNQDNGFRVPQLQYFARTLSLSSPTENNNEKILNYFCQYDPAFSLQSMRLLFVDILPSDNRKQIYKQYLDTKKWNKELLAEENLFLKYRQFFNWFIKLPYLIEENYSKDVADIMSSEQPEIRFSLTSLIKKHPHKNFKCLSSYMFYGNKSIIPLLDSFLQRTDFSIEDIDAILHSLLHEQVNEAYIRNFVKRCIESYQQKSDPHYKFILFNNLLSFFNHNEIIIEFVDNSFVDMNESFSNTSPSYEYIVSRYQPTLLHAACKRWRTKCIEFLLEKDIASSINTSNKEGQTPLMVLFQTDSSPIFNYYSERQYCSVLLQLTEAFLKKEARTDIIDIHGKNILHYFFDYLEGYSKCFINDTDYTIELPRLLTFLDTLCSHGANINHIDNDGNTPLLLFLKNINKSRQLSLEQKIKIIHYCIKKGADINHQNNTAESGLITCMSDTSEILLKQNFELFCFLMSQGALLYKKAQYTDRIYPSRSFYANPYEAIVKSHTYPNLSIIVKTITKERSKSFNHPNEGHLNTLVTTCKKDIELLFYLKNDAYSEDQKIEFFIEKHIQNFIQMKKIEWESYLDDLVIDTIKFKKKDNPVSFSTITPLIDNILSLVSSTQGNNFSISSEIIPIPTTKDTTTESIIEDKNLITPSEITSISPSLDDTATSFLSSLLSPIKKYVYELFSYGKTKKELTERITFLNGTVAALSLINFSLIYYIIHNNR